MFWHQNQDSSIWGSRDIERFRTRHTYYKMATKKFLGFSESGGHETWRNAKIFFDVWTDCHTFRSIELLLRKKII